MAHNKYIFIFLLAVCACTLAKAASPHGKEFKIDCATCHQTNNWENIKQNGYNHNKTNFPLTGQHKIISCKKCHTTLRFSEAKSECSTCHADIHEGTVGKDCERCHTTNSWIVNNIRQIHQQEGFPLLGPHNTADCNRCHLSSTKLRFDNIRSDCYACHSSEYESTTNPNHKSVGFDTDCERCHNLTGQNWLGSGYNHNFFPLKGGHEIECNRCHTQGYKGLSSECVSCHLTDYNTATNPSHVTANFSKECNTCHSINSWKPATFNHDSQFFPIYSGKHRGEWESCTDCHTNTNNYSSFTCTNCHEHNKTSMDNKHRGRSGYVYNSVNCYSCHPRGKAD
ncbi:hypothetical protein SDC9_86477 [bioreactor metagenome]|uniref:Cytochrome c7-like domain-containing protein n=1 Tax=bioreactor metagenome TaxID=1076179 RepID=A0A644ZJ08_9ZZZZ|nr:hypothetical protein [Paludibacter sp.]